MTGLPDDPSDRPTGMYGVEGSPQQVLDREPAGTDSDEASKPWYRNRIMLALWALVVALLLTLIIYGIVELSRGGGETTGPTTSTSSTTSTPSQSSAPSTTTSTSTETPPPPETPEQTPDEAPPPANNSPAPAPVQPPPRHHHHWHLPHFS